VQADTSSPVLDTTIGSVLREAAAGAAEAPAMVEGVPGDRRRWSYGELLAAAEQVARALLARFEPGERVAVWAPNVPEWVLLELGAGLAGVTLVTVNPAYQPRELRHVLGQSRSAGVVHAAHHRGLDLGAAIASVRDELPELREVVRIDDGWDAFVAGAGDRGLPDVAPDDPAMILYTSGTTGAPKGAVLTHRAVTNNARLYAERVGLGTPGSVYVNPMPLFHGGGCTIGVLGAMSQRAAHVSVLAFDPALVADLVEQEEATLLSGVPTMLIAVTEHVRDTGRRLPSLRTVLSGGATVPVDLVRRMEASLGVAFAIVYGQTEASICITQTSLDDTAEDKAQTIGRPLPQTEVAVVDPATGEPLPVGELGEIRTRGYLVMAGYFDMPEATREAVDEDGWLHTGDLGRMDERGYLTIEGRLKELIIRGGENIYPREIEEALMEHPGVGDVAVVGVPDERWGEQVAAVVRPTGPGATEEGLRAHLLERIARYKVPKVWSFVDAMPLTPSGKIQKHVLRERLAQR
jgi:fatty-acyl-CoA synthase